MMKGFLAMQGVNVGEKQVGAALQRVDPIYHHKRQQQLHRQVYPIPYSATYFGEKLHMYGAVNVCAINGILAVLLAMLQYQWKTTN